VPALDGVAFIDPRQSEVDIVQAVGRAIRKADDKTVGTIVIPVFIDTETDAEKALDSSVFKPVWDVLKALRAHDEELGRQLDALRRELGKTGGRPRLPDKIHHDLPARVGVDFVRAFEVRLVKETTASWEFWFGLLERFVELNGHARTTDSYTVDGYRLGSWVNAQRFKHNQGSLRADRAKRLGGLTGWTWNPHNDNWEEGFSRLLDYIEEHGHPRFPAKYRAKGYPLGQWVAVQRSARNRGRLNPDRERRLADLSGWTWDILADQWEEGFNRLLDYIEEHGHPRVPRPYTTADGYPLGVWAAKQRGYYNRGALDPDKRSRLADLPGWSWDAQDAKWEQGFRRLQEYVEHHGDARVPGSYTINGYQLGTWVVTQRVVRTRGELSSDRQRLLQDLSGWTWNILDAKWEEGFRRLQEYVEHHGDARVPSSYNVDGYLLGRWVVKQRVAQAQGKLDPDRRCRLVALPGWSWDNRASGWEEGFRRLVDYVEHYGDARVQKSHQVDGYRLGVWVATQRKRYARGLLEPDRQRLLQGLSGWTWNTLDVNWEESFSRLLEYVQLYGDARVPVAYEVDGYPLGKWIAVQRRFRTIGKLSSDRQRRLQDLPGWTWDATAYRGRKR
jgi:hypothetical protein